ncbi:MAG TPA: universal stress protein [Gemmatimonadales bacterium]|nr:universal stress protein [Gemmatimonadales bacterium]
MSTDSFTLQRVLVPLDGSTLAEEALPIAEVVAREAGADLHLVSVQPPMLPAGAEFGLSHGEVPLSGNRDDVEAYLALVARRVARAHGGHAVTAVVCGDPAERLADYIKTNAISLVVMTTHGRGGFSRVWLGSVADRLIRRTGAPVLLLRHDTRMNTARFQRIVIALDGSPAAERAVAPALTLGSFAIDPRYTLVRVVEPPLPPTMTPVGLYPPDVAVPSPQEVSAAAKEYLESVANRIRARGYSVDTRVLVGSTAQQIVQLAERYRSQLITMGTRGAKGLDRLVLGSVADKVVRSARQPVLVTPMERATTGGGERAGTAGATTAHSHSEVLIP